MYESISGLTKNGLNLRYKPTAFGKKTEVSRALKSVMLL